jgi:DnaJ-class molecular chaperone
MIRKVTCPGCGGDGGYDSDDAWHECDTCNGDGGWFETDSAPGFGVTMVDDYGQEPQAEGGT